MNGKNFSYDVSSDSLIVLNKNGGEIVKDNFEFDDMVFSLTRKGKIASIEIREFSNFLKQGEISNDFLLNLSDVRLKVVVKNKNLAQQAAEYF